jgi:hypothetical protein
MNTTAQEVFDSFEGMFADKHVIPEELELLWLKKAVARFSVELDPLTFDSENLEFSNELNQYVIDTLAAFMKQMYQEREVSKVNKRVSIVTKDISVDGNGNAKTAAKSELDYCDTQSKEMIFDQMPTAYS